MYSEEYIQRTTGKIVELADLAMRFGRVNRTGPQHVTGEPESDSDHTVMLTWIAPTIADLINKRLGYTKYDTREVCTYAALHDAVEVYAGDTPTVKITTEELVAKEQRESEASSKLSVQFDGWLPWFSRTLRAYERQHDQNARLVRAVDKLLPKLVHILCKGNDLVRSGFTLEDFRGVVARQRQQIVDWSNDPLLLAIYDATTADVEASWPSPAVPQPTPHYLVVYEPSVGGGFGLRHGDCGPGVDIHDCPVRVVFDAYVDYLMGSDEFVNPGEYPIELTDDGQLAFVGKQD